MGERASEQASNTGNLAAAQVTSMQLLLEHSVYSRTF
jgi:hypothetical protein